jgi:putative dimethyl sulfoxide reductase chaperone
MRTPSKAMPPPPLETQEWAARPARAPKSVFGNYPQGTADSAEARAAEVAGGAGGGAGDRSEPLQAGIDAAMARAFVYRFLAQAFADPTTENWAWMSAADNQHAVDCAVRALAPSAPGLEAAAAALRGFLKPAGFEPFREAYLAAFGHAARGGCPLNEIEYGDLKADPLFQPHRLADLAAFYRAFGLEVADEAHERQDHLCLELEFMCVLAAKEAYALEHQLDGEDLGVCRAAQKRFLREHLGRWTPAFARRLGRMAGGNALGALANLARSFVEAECAWYGVVPGSAELLLRPVDEAAESLCHSCGLTQPPPGGLDPGQP